MSNDGKLGLLAGVAAVLLIAVVHHRKTPVAGPPAGSLPTPQRADAPAPPPVSVLPKPNALPAPADPLLRLGGE